MNNLRSEYLLGKRYYLKVLHHNKKSTVVSPWWIFKYRFIVLEINIRDLYNEIMSRGIL